MASRAADLMDLEENRVRVTIDKNLLHFLHVARFLALPPELIAAAAEIHGPLGAQSLVESLLVHPGHHQHLAAGGVLGDGWNKAAGFVEVNLHKASSNLSSIDEQAAVAV